MNLILIENKSKVKFIIKNPRFFINVKEKIKDSVKALSNVKLGGRFNRNVIPKTSESQRRRDKSQNVITIIRRQNIQTDSRPFSAYPLHRTQTLKMSQEKRAPNTAYGRHNFKNMSMNTIKWGRNNYDFRWSLLISYYYIFYANMHWCANFYIKT